MYNYINLLRRRFGLLKDLELLQGPITLTAKVTTKKVGHCVVVLNFRD